MKLMTWNVMGNCGIGARRRPKVLDIIREVGPDVVLLQEVHAAKGLPAYLADGLHDVGLNHAVWGPADPKKYGNMILSRWSVERMPRWNAVPWPQSVLRCRVEHPEQDFEAVSVHIPNGSANGWLKIETFEALAAGLSGLECPFVVGGDFNEPRTVLDDGTTIPFTMKQRADGTTLDKRAHSGSPPVLSPTFCRDRSSMKPVSLVCSAARHSSTRLLV